MPNSPGTVCARWCPGFRQHAAAPDLRQRFLERIENSDSFAQADTPQTGMFEETLASSEQSAEKADTPAGIPKEFGRYEIRKLLGEGGMGAVYQAFDTQLHRLIALKVPKISGDAPESLARFYREARAESPLANARMTQSGMILGTPAYMSVSYTHLTLPTTPYV